MKKKSGKRCTHGRKTRERRRVHHYQQSHQYHVLTFKESQAYFVYTLARDLVRKITFREEKEM